MDLADVPAELRAAAAAALAAVGIEEGHLAIELVDEDRIRELNRAHRGIDRATDVLAFPLDGPGPASGPRELGDVLICPQHCSDLAEAAVHGTLHLCGFDHEADDGEMLALQSRILRDLRSTAHPPASERGSEGPSVSDSSGPSGNRGGGRKL